MTRVLDGVTWFDTDDFGVVERTDAEAIVTSFYTVILPVWPEHSAYLSTDDEGRTRRIAIPLHTRSVVLGLVRAPTWLAAWMLALPALLVDGLRWLIVPALALAIVATLLQFVAGRLGEDERLRRELLRRVVGVGVPPELLADDVRAVIRTDLVERWQAERPRTSWTDAIERGHSAEILVALAEYHGDAELVARAQANAANRAWN